MSKPLRPKLRMAPPVSVMASQQVSALEKLQRLQAFIGSTANGLVAGVIAPLVMHSTPGLAAVSLGMLCVGLAAWVYLHHRWPEIGRAVQ